MVLTIPHDWLTPKRAVIGVIAVILITAAGTVQLSLAEDTRRDEIRFYHLSDKAGSFRDSLRRSLEASYPGSFTDTARVGAYTFDDSTEVDENGYCTLEPVVKHNGQVVDDYGLDKQIESHSSYSDGTDTDNNKQQYGPLTAEFANPHYMETGYWIGFNGCYGTFNRYHLAVNQDAISVDVQTPDKAVEGQAVTTTVTVSNGWQPLRADLSTEVGIDGQFCRTLTKKDIAIDRGTTTVEFTYTPDTAGDVSASVSGPVGLDLQRYPVDGASVDCDGDGQKEAPATCRMITVGEVQGGGVTAVKAPRNAVFDNDLLVPAVQEWWARTTHRLFAGLW